MALATTMFCNRCKKAKDIIVAGGMYPNVCHECEREIDKEKADAHIAEMKLLTIEERIERLERLQLGNKSQYFGPTMIGQFDDTY